MDKDSKLFYTNLSFCQWLGVRGDQIRLSLELSWCLAKKCQTDKIDWNVTEINMKGERDFSWKVSVTKKCTTTTSAEQFREVVLIKLPLVDLFLFQIKGYWKTTWLSITDSLLANNQKTNSNALEMKYKKEKVTVPLTANGRNTYGLWFFRLVSSSNERHFMFLV